MKIGNIIALRGATAYEVQIGCVWFKFLRRRFWRSSGIRRLISTGIDRTDSEE